MTPDKDSAFQFAVMLQAGLPAAQAILYFLPPDVDPGEAALTCRKWLSSSTVKTASAKLLGKSWTDMTLDEKIKVALDHHYAGLAYFLFSHNYTDLGQQEKLKADTARQALEAKMAGVAGKTDALSQFFNDINSGKIVLNKPIPVATN